MPLSQINDISFLSVVLFNFMSVVNSRSDWLYFRQLSKEFNRLHQLWMIIHNKDYLTTFTFLYDRLTIEFCFIQPCFRPVNTWFNTPRHEHYLHVKYHLFERCPGVWVALVQAIARFKFDTHHEGKVSICTSV